MEVIFTYDVKWELSDIKWASRWDLYLYMGDDQIHWCVTTQGAATTRDSCTRATTRSIGVLPLGEAGSTIKSRGLLGAGGLSWACIEVTLRLLGACGLSWGLCVLPLRRVSRIEEGKTEPERLTRNPMS